ncbi:MAG: SAM-dependent methyltransferase [Epulopiscium sp.]|nr:SAM-dependent methyltransferase [Candidatus Epulonipiscium sp.]
MDLPQKFIQRMKIQLKEEWKDYLQIFNEPYSSGLRVNTLKISPQKFKQIAPFQLEPISWCKEGFYYQKNVFPAKHPYHHAGLYYLQEPSAMAPGAILDIEPGDIVLDLCAAPGGKSTHLGARLNNQGVLISNDISPTRGKALLKNIELFGIRNAVILSETPEKLSTFFPEYFTKIIVDAPCSGEGMFRKDPSAIKNWENYGAEYCCPLQKNILDNAAAMLKPDGLLLYSTCTFSPEENEGIIENFLKCHPEFNIVPIPLIKGFSKGKPDWVNGRKDLENTVRLWPYKLKGEGHFIALLKKNNYKIKSASFNFYKNSSSIRNKQQDNENLNEFYCFINEVIKDPSLLQGNIQLIGQQVFLVPDGIPSLKGIRVLRSGWYLGELKKKRFEPSQGFAMGLTKESVNQVIDFSVNDTQVIRYLKGETIEIKGNAGWNLVCVEGYPLGWGKIQNGRLKNKYLSSWRWM